MRAWIRIPTGHTAARTQFVETRDLHIAQEALTQCAIELCQAQQRNGEAKLAFSAANGLLELNGEMVVALNTILLHIWEVGCVIMFGECRCSIPHVCFFTSIPCVYFKRI